MNDDESATAIMTPPDIPSLNFQQLQSLVSELDSLRVAIDLRIKELQETEAQRLRDQAAANGMTVEIKINGAPHQKKRGRKAKPRDPEHHAER